ncbi:MAG: glycosyltransferase family 4 protein [Mariniblastus sp.]
MIVVILAFLASLLTTWLLIPWLAKFAKKVGLVDHPDNKRKLHVDAIPMVGGLAIFITVFIIAPLAIWAGVQYQTLFQSLAEDLLGWLPVDFGRRGIRFNHDSIPELAGLFVGSAILVGVGVLDDRFGIRGRQKLLGQFVAVTALIIFGYHFDKVTIANITINFDVFSVLFVYAWVIAAINSVNLLDGADGVAATIGVVMSVALALMAVFLGLMVDAIIAITIAGALIGFLRFNFPPAKVYLGDTGSMLIGFLLAALAIRSTFKQNTAYAFFAPIALLGIPFIDTAAAIIRRRLTGRSIFAVDRGHLHHALIKQGYSPRSSLLWVALLCTTTAAGAVASLVFQQAEFALASVGIAVTVMIGFKVFGVAEYHLVSRKASTLARSFLHLNKEGMPDVIQSAFHMQGNHDWQDDWELLCKFADDNNLVQLKMDLNAPWLHESFHATRRRSDVPKGGNHEWSSEIPLVAEGRVFGRVEIVGNEGNEKHRELIAKALVVTEQIETAFLNFKPENTRAKSEPNDESHQDPVCHVVAGANGTANQLTDGTGTNVSSD